jgi:predicted nucleic acid-binding protein
LLDLVAARRGNLRRVSPQFRFRVISADPDDEQFVDCAIVADAEWIITEDGHFDVLAGAGYRPQPIAPQELIRRFLP